MIKFLTEQLSGKLGKTLNLNPGQANRFARMARESDIGGQGVDFRKMNLDDQNRFIEQYNKAQPGQGSSTSEVLTRQQRVRQGSEQLSPQEKMDLHDARQRAVDENSLFDIGRGEREAIQQRQARAEVMQGKIDAQGGAIEGYYDPPMRRAPRKQTGASHQRLGSANPRSATPIDVDQSRPVKPIVERAVEAAPGEPGLMQRMFGGLAGDTSGRAAAEAGQNFEQSYRNVFSSEATAEAFGVERNVLERAFDQTGDEFAATLRAGNLDEKAIEGLEAFRGEVRRVADEGGNLSEEGMQAMLTNTGEVGNMYAGFSRAGATASPNALLRGMAGEGTGMESVMGIAAVAGLAGGANVMMGGDFTEGAAVGGIGAMSVRGIAKGVAGSMGDIENAMMKSILGDDIAEEGARRTIVAEGTTIKELAEGGRGDLKVSDLGLPNKKNAGQTVEDLYTGSKNAGDLKTRTTLETDPLTGGQARRQNLEAIQRMGDDDERLQGFGKKKMRDLLNPNKEKNVAMNNRALVLGGGMLSGVAFTGNADRRDYRRGFNAHIGNRI